jgi:RimJ/RimL family protein N-acetyltransferase
MTEIEIRAAGEDDVPSARHLARLARERNCGRLEWSVLDWNEPAIGLYRSIGAVPMDEWRVYRLTGEALYELAGH